MANLKTIEFTDKMTFQLGNLTPNQEAVFKQCCDEWTEDGQRRWNEWTTVTKATVLAAKEG